MRILDRLKLSRKTQKSPPLNPRGEPGFVSLINGRPVFTPVTKATLADIQEARTTNLDQQGVGQEWAPTVYGEYMATSTPAYRAITARANAVKSAPLQVLQTNASGDTVPVGPNNPVQQILKRVNPWWTASDLINGTETYLSTWGSAFWFLNDKGGSVPKDIWLLRPDRMKIVPGNGLPVMGGDEYIRGFIYEVNGKKKVLLNEEIVWFRYLNPLDEYGGLSPLAAARMSLDSGKDAIKYNRFFFKNNATPTVVFPVEGPIDPERAKDFYDKLDERYASPEKSHRPMLWDLTGAEKPITLGMTQKDMEFFQGLEFTLEEAARVWGVPKEMMMSGEGTTFSNRKEARIQFYVETVTEEWRFLEAELNELLLPRFPNTENLTIKFDTSGVFALQEALVDLDKQSLEKIDHGAITINEWRESRGLEPLPWGDVWWPEGQPGPVVDENPPSIAAPPSSATLSINGSVYKAVSADLVEEAGDTFVTRLEAFTERMTEVMRELFEKQRRETLRKITSASRQRLRALDFPTLMDEIQQKRDPLPVGEVIFDIGEWADAFSDDKFRILSAILVDEIRTHAELFGLGAIDTQAPDITAWLSERLAFWADVENRETAQLLMSEIQVAIEAEESIPQIQKRVNKVFDFNDKVRSERIARTEVHAAMNRAHLEAYDQSAVVVALQWLTTIDGRERQDHRGANSLRVPKGAKFFVGGEFLDGPGQGSIPANNINCRCTTLPLLPKDVEGKPQNQQPGLLTVMDDLAELKVLVEGNGNDHHMRVVKTIERDEEGIPIRVIEEHSTNGATNHID